MIFTNKLLPVALIAALVGSSVGALVMYSRNQSASAETASSTPNVMTPQPTAVQNSTNPEFATAAEETAYKAGFADGYQAATESKQQRAASTSRTRVVYRNAGSNRRVYYDYGKTQGRSFWQKHRDKLTLAMGTGGGALIGGLIGGKKGAAIGALSGLGGSALYTYKLRKRNRSY